MQAAFGSPERPLHLHTLRRGSELLAVLPLQRHGGVTRLWGDFQEVRLTPFWQFAVRDGCLGEVAGSLLDHLFDGADVLRLRRLHSDGAIRAAFEAAARERGLVTEAFEHGSDCFLELPDGWETFRADLSTKLRKNTERADRRLAESGELTFAAHEREEGLDALLEECMQLERLGWKGESGDTIESRPAWRRFYSELAHGSARAGRLALYTLRLDGALLAYDLCLRAQGRINLLKISYHPDFNKHSPSNVLRYKVFRREIESGEVRVYHFGDPSDWKLRWTDRVTPLVDLHVYAAGPRGRLARLAGPRTRNALKSLAPVRALLRRPRS
jgi:CelD/BcsL family acetyltransferase involved in cellulose biosynthesis